MRSKIHNILDPIYVTNPHTIKNRKEKLSSHTNECKNYIYLTTTKAISKLKILVLRK